jgi:glycosyltransferase involved in cell wall biosynthesis
MSGVSILCLNLYGSIGGAERALLELAMGLDKSRFTPCVVLGEAGPLEPRLRQNGVLVRVEAFPSPPLHHLLLPWVALLQARAAWRLFRLARQLGARVLQCGDVLALLLLLPAAWSGNRVVYQPNFLGGRARLFVLNLLALLTAAEVVAVSADQRARLEARTRGLRGRTRVVHPGIEPSAYEQGDAAVLRKELGLQPGTLLVGMLARFDSWKGHLLFLEAAARIRRERQDVRFVAVGGALNAHQLPHVTRCQQAVLERRSELGLEDAVALLGHRDDVKDVLAALDVFVCPSDHEPFGMVVLEALAAARPVVVADSGGPAEIVEDGRSGLVFRTGDADSLAAAVLRVLSDADLALALGGAGRLRVHEAFLRERYAREMETLYAQLLLATA